MVHYRKGDTMAEEKIKAGDISCQKNINGVLVLSTVYNGYRVQRSYSGYTKREAIKQFKVDARGTTCAK